MSDEPRDQASLAPEATPLPEANRARLEALLRELLRDRSLCELLCREEETRAAIPRRDVTDVGRQHHSAEKQGAVFHCDGRRAASGVRYVSTDRGGTGAPANIVGSVHCKRSAPDKMSLKGPG